MTWKFFNASNVMIKESNVTNFPLQSTNIENRVQILETEDQHEQYCTPLSQSDCRYFFVLAIMTVTLYSLF